MLFTAMQELLAREEAHNQRLLASFLDAAWSVAKPTHYLITTMMPHHSYGHNGKHWRKHDGSETIVTRGVMEQELLARLRCAYDINATCDNSKISVKGRDSYLYITIQAVCAGAGDADLSTTGAAFLRWEDEVALLRQVVDQRLAKRESVIGPVLLEHADGLLRCAECWLRRIYACEAMRTHVIFPAQLENAQGVYPLEKKDEED
jgi:hypothetical protein